MTDDKLIELIDQEFSCHYMGDELPREWNEDEVATRAGASLARIVPRLDAADRAQLANALRAAKDNPRHPLVEVMGEGSNVFWEDAQLWPALRQVLGRIIEGLERSE